MRGGRPRLPGPGVLGQFFVATGVPDWTSFPAGPEGGALGCGAVPHSATICAWADSSAVAEVAQSGVTPGDLAQTAPGFRSAAEH